MIFLPFARSKGRVDFLFLCSGLTEAEYVAKGTPTEACHCSIYDAQHLPAIYRLQAAGR